MIPIAPDMSSFRSYLVQAGYAWILDNQMTPYLVVDATYPGVDVPSSSVRDARVVLNLAPRAVANFRMDHDFVRFHARFAGKSAAVEVPMAAVLNIHAMETRAGFDLPPSPSPPNHPSRAPAISNGIPTTVAPGKPATRSRDHLRVVK